MTQSLSKPAIPERKGYPEIIRDNLVINIIIPGLQTFPVVELQTWKNVGASLGAD